MQKSQSFILIEKVFVLKKLFQDQQQALTHFYNSLDYSRAEAVVNFCMDVTQAGGLLIFTGVGKSGIVAEKIAMTLISTGTRALYLPAANFLHGDIGIVTERDAVIMLSKSGESEELLNLVSFLRRRKSKIVAWISNERSRLALQADLPLVLPVQKELCPFDLAPTTSTEVQLLFGDVLAIALMEKQQFSLTSYGNNHPSGMIGKKASISVQDLMVPFDKLPLCLSSYTLQKVLPQFSEKRLGCVIIVDEHNALKGIFTDGDLRRALQSYGMHVMQKPLEELMIKSALTVESHEKAWTALKLMQKDPHRPITALPVLQEKKVVGLIHIHHIIGAGIT
jgi:arabinose-5-phosphate isomerase